MSKRDVPREVLSIPECLEVQKAANENGSPLMRELVITQLMRKKFMDIDMRKRAVIQVMHGCGVSGIKDADPQIQLARFITSLRMDDVFKPSFDATVEQMQSHVFLASPASIPSLIKKFLPGRPNGDFSVMCDNYDRLVTIFAMAKGVEAVAALRVGLIENKVLVENEAFQWLAVDCGLYDSRIQRLTRISAALILSYLIQGGSAAILKKISWCLDAGKCSNKQYRRSTDMTDSCPTFLAYGFNERLCETTTCSAAHVLANLADIDIVTLRSNAFTVDLMCQQFLRDSTSCLSKHMVTIARRDLSLLSPYVEDFVLWLRSTVSQGLTFESKPAARIAKVLLIFTKEQPERFLRNESLVNSLTSLLANRAEHDWFASWLAKAVQELWQATRKDGKVWMCPNCFLSENFFDLMRSCRQSKNTDVRMLSTTFDSFLRKQRERIRTAIFQEVGALVDFRGHDLVAPDGVMLLRTNSSTVWARGYRCPNQAACKNTRSLSHLHDPSEQASAASDMCAVGYDSSSPGCTECMRRYGRSQFDPHKCIACAPPVAQRFGFVVLPLGLFGVGAASAIVAGKGLANLRQSGLTKIFLSFSAAATIVVNALQNAKQYVATKAYISSFLDASSSVSSSVTTFYSGSYDCLLDKPMAPVSEWLLLSAAMPAFIALAIIVVHLIHRCLKYTRLAWVAERAPVDAVQLSLVWGNVFLPALFGSVLRFYPCMHLKRDDLEHAVFRQSYRPTALCSERPLFGILAGTAVIALAGPVYWSVIMSMKDSSEDYASTFQFLQVTYKERAKQWEVVVLARKLSLAAVAATMPVSYASTSHVLGTSLIIVISLVAHALYNPFDDTLLNWVEFGSLSVSGLALICAVYVTADQWSSTVKDQQRLLAFALCLVCAYGLLLLSLLAKQLYSVARKSLMPMMDNVQDSPRALRSPRAPQLAEGALR